MWRNSVTFVTARALCRWICRGSASKHPEKKAGPLGPAVRVAARTRGASFQRGTAALRFVCREEICTTNHCASTTSVGAPAKGDTAVWMGVLVL